MMPRGLPSPASVTSGVWSPTNGFSFDIFTPSAGPTICHGDAASTGKGMSLGAPLGPYGAKSGVTGKKNLRSSSISAQMPP